MQSHQLKQLNISSNRLFKSSFNKFSTDVTLDGEEDTEYKEKIRLKKMKKIQKRKQKKKQKKQINLLNNTNNNTNNNTTLEVANQQKQLQVKQLNQIPTVDIGFVIYQQQLQKLYNCLSEYISNSINIIQGLMNSNKGKQSTNILVIGPHNSGRKHLLNQTLIKLHSHYLTIYPNTIKLNIIKRFINEQQQNKYIVKNEQKEQQSVRNKQITNQLSLISTSSSSYINLIVNFIHTTRKVLSKQLQITLQKEHQRNDQQQRQQPNLIVVNAYFITTLQYNNHNWLYAQNTPLLVQIPQPIHFTNNHLQRLQQFLTYQLKKIQIQLNANNNNSTTSILIQYGNTVIAFTIKFLVKKHQQNKITCCHPILAMRYLHNYLYNRFRSQLNFIRSYQSQQQQSANQSITLKLSTQTITTFLNSLLSANQQNPISSINLSSLIFIHQLLLVSCYLYLTSKSYLNALYINAQKLYRYFVITQQTLMIEKIQEKKYWQGLEKLKDLGLLKFAQDKKTKQSTTINRRFTNNIKFIKDYKNQNFYLTFGIEKIKQDLQDMEIYAKFFIKQNED